MTNAAQQAYINWLADRGLTPIQPSPKLAPPAPKLQVLFVSDTPLTDDELALLEKMAGAMKASSYEIIDSPAGLTSPAEIHICLGSKVAELALGHKIQKSDRGTLMPAAESQVLPTFHPRDLLLRPEFKRLAWTDLRAAMDHLGISH